MKPEYSWCVVTLCVDIMKVDTLVCQKISKSHFLKDIENFLHEVTHIGPEPAQFFSFLDILTNTVTKDVQSH